MSKAATEKYKILLVEDNEAVNQRVTDVLRHWSKGNILTPCLTVADATHVLRQDSVDILVSDLDLPDGHGVDIIREFKQRNPEGLAIVLSVLMDGDVILRAIQAGAIGYIQKDDDSIGILKALDMIIEGNSPISPVIARQIIQSVRHNDAVRTEEPTVTLTARELEILNLVAKGFTYKEIADICAISVNTVTVHARNIYRKLEAGNRTEAVFEAHKIGLIQL